MCIYIHTCYVTYMRDQTVINGNTLRCKSRVQIRQSYTSININFNIWIHRIVKWFYLIVKYSFSYRKFWDPAPWHYHFNFIKETFVFELKIMPTYHKCYIYFSVRLEKWAPKQIHIFSIPHTQYWFTYIHVCMFEPIAKETILRFPYTHIRYVWYFIQFIYLCIVLN